MAVDFSSKATDINTLIEPETRVVEPVSRQGQIDALDNIGRGIGNAIKTAVTYNRTRDTAAANKRLANFNIRLSELDDAVDQGGISTAEALTRKRQLLQEHLAADPNNEETYLERYSKNQSQSGINKTLTPGLQQAEANAARVKALTENGFLSLDKMNDPAAVEKANDEYEAFVSSNRELEKSSKELANRSSRIDVANKEKAAEVAEAEANVINGLAKVGQSALPYWRTQYENIKAAAAKAGSEQERQEIIKQGVIQLQTDFAQRTAALAGDGLRTNQAKIDQILKPQKDLIDTYVKELSGEYDTEMFTRMSKGAEARAKAMVWEGLDEDAKRWIAMSQLTQAWGDVLRAPLAGVAANFAKNAAAGETVGGPDERGVGGKPADLTPVTDNEKKTTKAYLDNVTKMMEDVNTGKLNKMAPEQKVEVEKELETQVKGILRSVDVYKNATESASQFQPLVDFFANPTVGQYLQGRGGIPAELRGKVAQVFKDGYQTQVVPMMQEELTKMYARDMKSVTPGGQLTVKAGDIVEPTMETGRFGFKLKEGAPDEPMAKALLQNLNNSAFTKVMNKMIISDAHIQGNNDYQKSYDALAPIIFQSESEAKPEEKSEYVDPVVKKAENDFDLTSLVEQASFDPTLDASTLEGDLRDVAQAIDIGESGGDYGALLGFTNRPGRKFDEVNITDMTINELLEFSDGSGVYGAYTKKQLGKVATPMGRYQIVGSTLKRLKNKLGLTGEEKFTPEMQDKLFLSLLRGRGYDKYKAGEISKEDLLANLQNEWEGLSKSKKSFNALVASL